MFWWLLTPATSSWNTSMEMKFLRHTYWRSYGDPIHTSAVDSALLPSKWTIKDVAPSPSLSSTMTLWHVNHCWTLTTICTLPSPTLPPTHPLQTPNNWATQHQSQDTESACWAAPRSLGYLFSLSLRLMKVPNLWKTLWLLNAFNTIQPWTLREKLLVMQLHPDTASWTLDYFTIRPQYIRVDGCASEIVIRLTPVDLKELFWRNSSSHSTPQTSTSKRLLMTDCWMHQQQWGGVQRTDRELCHMVQQQSPEAQNQQDQDQLVVDYSVPVIIQGEKVEREDICSSMLSKRSGKGRKKRKYECSRACWRQVGEFRQVSSVRKKGKSSTIWIQVGDSLFYLFDDGKLNNTVKILCKVFQEGIQFLHTTEFVLITHTTVCFSSFQRALPLSNNLHNSTSSSGTAVYE